jgi:hypothetical protein
VSLQTLRDDIRMYGRYSRDLRGFLRHPLNEEACVRLLERQRASRDDNFLRVLEHGVFRHPTSPYLKLFRHAGIELGDVEAMIREDGIEQALERLYDAGVHVTLDEVKLHQPVRRGSLEFETTERAWDNPLPMQHFEGRSGGSRSPGRRTVFDLAHITTWLPEWALILRGFGLTGRPGSVWYPAPPGVGGLAVALSLAKMDGYRAERWFSQTKLDLRPWRARGGLLLTATTFTAGKLWGGGRVPWPRHASLDDPAPVARWLADQVRGGKPAVMNTYPSAAVRASRVALEEGLDISGSAFLLGGEAYTAEKAQVLGAADARGIAGYGMSEVGAVGAACAAAEHPDDLHLLTQKVGVIQRPVRIGDSEVGALILTTLLPSSPKLMINVDSGDYGSLDERPCGCAFAEAGLDRHLHGIRSHEKLTSQGMTFLGEELLELVDKVLPGRFGGAPQDFQIVEEERSGLPRVSIVANPTLGELDEAEVRATALHHLARAGVAQRMMAEVWATGDSLRVERRPPYVTSGGKVLPLHVPTTRHRATADAG